MALLVDLPVEQASGSEQAKVAEEARLERIFLDYQVDAKVVAVHMLMLCNTVLCSDVLSMACHWNCSCSAASAAGAAPCGDQVAMQVCYGLPHVLPDVMIWYALQPGFAWFKAPYRQMS